MRFIVPGSAHSSYELVSWIVLTWELLVEGQTDISQLN